MAEEWTEDQVPLRGIVTSTSVFWRLLLENFWGLLSGKDMGLGSSSSLRGWGKVFRDRLLSWWSTDSRVLSEFISPDIMEMLFLFEVARFEGVLLWRSIGSWIWPKSISLDANGRISFFGVAWFKDILTLTGLQRFVNVDNEILPLLSPALLYPHTYDSLPNLEASLWSAQSRKRPRFSIY